MEYIFYGAWWVETSMEQFNVTVCGGSVSEKKYYYQLFMDMIGKLPTEWICQKS